MWQRERLFKGFVQGAAVAATALVLAVGLAACGGGGSGGGDDDDATSPPAAREAYVVLAWNDLGMHCLNPTYDSAVVLPPYNTLWAQVVRRGNPPEIVTAGVDVKYEFVGNTTSQKSSDATSGSPVTSDFTQFWANALKLFGVNLPSDTGLTGNSISAVPQPMKVVGNHFEATGVPITPLKDDLTWNPYQVAKITVSDSASGAQLITTQATVPTSDEIRCDKCHGDTVDPFIPLHDEDHGGEQAWLLAGNQPFVCANKECHGSPALGLLPPGPAGYLSEAIHSFHGHLNPASDPVPACFDCHPGTVTRCNRSLRHTAADGGCVPCHGNLAEVGDSIANDGRIPWAEEKSKCATCHGTSIPQVDTGTTLYRNAFGHGGLACPACHGSPHAMLPSREASDGYQTMQYQGKAITLGSCGVCHDSSKGEGLSEFAEEHGGTSPERQTACHVCHTAVPVEPTKWPHAYKWNPR